MNRTCEKYKVSFSDDKANLKLRLMKPSDRLAFAVMQSTCLLQVRADERITPRYLPSVKRLTGDPPIEYDEAENETDVNTF